MKNSLIISASLLFAILFCPLFAEAQLVIDPTAGVVLWNSTTSHEDELAGNRALGFTGDFFGSSVSHVDVSTNGNLNFSGDIDGGNNPLPDGFQIPRISPLWDAQIINAGDGATIVEKKLPGVYYSVTWNGVEAAPGSSGNIFQAVWFGADTRVRGFDFKKNDIAFSYASLAGGFDDRFSNSGATIGLDKGDYATYAALPGTDDGLVTAADNLNLIPVDNGSFVLFHPDGNGSYLASIETLSSPVPAPNSLIVMFAGTAPLVFTILFRKRFPGRISVEKYVS